MEKLNLQSNFVNIYVSGSFQNKGKINLFINELRKRGFNITFDWTIEFSTIKDHNKYHISSIQAVNGIRECDILIAIFNSNTDISRGIFTEIGAAILVGGAIGTFIALRIEMTALPQLVAAFHSLVGIAAVFVAAAAFYDPASFGIGNFGSIGTSSLVEMSIGTFIGAITFSGSILAFGK